MEKAAVPSRMTGNAAALFNDEQHDIPVAIQSNFLYFLHVTRLFTFMPEFFAGAGPVVRLACFRCKFQRLAVHPGDHQHFIAACFLCYRLDQSVI
jgi:hypothetical protein